MANQPTPARPWFRLATTVRPAAPVPTPGPAPAPAPAPAPEPRPPLIRSTFRPLPPSQPTQRQEPIPPPSAAAGPVPTAAPPPAPAPAPAIAAPLPVATTASVPSSPTPRVSAPSVSLPTSPALKAALASSTVPLVTSTSSLPSSPKAKVSAPSSSVRTSPVTKAVVSSASVQTSPITKAAQAQTFSTTKTATTTTSPSATTATAHVPSPIPRPKTINPAVQTTPQSLKPKPIALPPSPLILPPSQLKSDTEAEQKIPMEVEQKTVLVQKTVEKPKPWLGGNGVSQRELGESYKPSIIPIGKQEVSKEVETKEKEKSSGKKISDSEELGMRVITIAGENKGAFMEVIQSPNKHEVGYKNGNPKTRSHGGDSESYISSDKEGNAVKDKSHKEKETASLPSSTFMNSNVQSINNSILYNCSCTHHDPGVHLALSRKPTAEFQVKDRVNGNQN